MLTILIFFWGCFLWAIFLCKKAHLPSIHMWNVERFLTTWKQFERAIEQRRSPVFHIFWNYGTIVRNTYSICILSICFIARQVRVMQYPKMRTTWHQDDHDWIHSWKQLILGMTPNLNQVSEKNVWDFAKRLLHSQVWYCFYYYLQQKSFSIVITLVVSESCD